MKNNCNIIKSCQIMINSCQSSPCLNGLCSQFGDGFVCICSFGYTGVRCDQLVNYCSSAPCTNGGTCANQVGGYV